MKTLIPVLLISLFCSCSDNITMIGQVSYISNRNIEKDANYELLRSYMGGSKKQLQRSRAKDLQTALDETIKNTAGGEFLKNAKIYQVNGKYYAVEGDVWGLTENLNFQGWKVGDRVQYNRDFSTFKGVITELTNAKVCTVKEDSGKLKQIPYETLKRSE